MRLATVTALGGLLLGLAGCGPDSSAPAPAAPGPSMIALVSTNVRSFAVRGVVREVRPADRVLVVKHEAIPDYMAAMTMPFSYQDTNAVRSLKPGDLIAFRLRVTDDDGWIEDIVRIGATNPPAAPRDPLRQVKLVEPLSIGDPLPAYAFTNELGHPFTLGQFKGDVVGLTFFYTRCPYPAFCPRLAAHFSEVSHLLSQPGNTFTNWHLVSLSFDPENDTLPVLKAYAQSRRSNPARWTFGTGSLVNIDAITEQFGLEFPRDGDFFDHNLRTVVIDARGRVARILKGNAWKPEDLVEAMREVASKPRTGRSSGSPLDDPAAGVEPR